VTPDDGDDRRAVYRAVMAGDPQAVREVATIWEILYRMSAELADDAVRELAVVQHALVGNAGRELYLQLGAIAEECQAIATDAERVWNGLLEMADRLADSQLGVLALPLTEDDRVWDDEPVPLGVLARERAYQPDPAALAGAHQAISDRIANLATIYGQFSEGFAYAVTAEHEVAGLPESWAEYDGAWTPPSRLLDEKRHQGAALPYPRRAERTEPPGPGNPPGPDTPKPPRPPAVDPADDMPVRVGAELAPMSPYHLGGYRSYEPDELTGTLGEIGTPSESSGFGEFGRLSEAGMSGESGVLREAGSGGRSTPGGDRAAPEIDDWGWDDGGADYGPPVLR
jgi:hypothetical protein